MRTITSPAFNALLKAAQVKNRLRQEVRFAPEAIDDWDEREFIAVSDRANAKGVLILELDDQRFVVPYEIQKRVADRSTGRTKPVICDFCFTWQKGAYSARIQFTRSADAHDITFICCADLQCSRHVRNKTAAAHLSRSQLREDLNNDQRVERLRRKLSELMELLEVRPLVSAD